MYRSLKDCVLDLEKTGQLVRIKTEVDPDLEVAEIHRRIYEAKGPAILFENIKGSPFPALSNLYGTHDRIEFIFRKTLSRLKKVIALKVDPFRFLQSPFTYRSAPFTALNSLPMKQWGRSPVLYKKTQISQLPQIKSWGMDGGAFITLPQVMSLPPNSRNLMASNLGMYRIQLSGNDYIKDQEIGLHYQLHRGIGVHHTLYNKSKEPFRASIFVGGPPSHAFSAIMPLPEGLTELTFAGMLAGRRFRYAWKNNFVISSDADFCITGIIKKGIKKREGPFGDHLGYYSLEHDFPVMEVENVYHRKDAIWHFTVVGRPPQEDSSFGYLIHELVKDLTPQEFPGIKEINAVDAAGVHPLLLAIGSERYMPFRESKPEEILTQANRILGTGQTSLAKYLWIAAGNDDPVLNTHDIPYFFNHILERIDWARDLHFQTNTTIDTLDYSGSGWNAGSKVVIACCGSKKRTLEAALPANFDLPNGFTDPIFFQKGILVIKTTPYTDTVPGSRQIEHFAKEMEKYNWENIPLIVLTDDSRFATATLNNFVWTTFTRSNPASDIHGVHASIKHKHWGCKGALIIDARIKPHHAPPLIVDKQISAKVDKFFSKGGELYHLNDKKVSFIRH